MNAIIALCHFCDQHGPRTLFCTQAFKYTDHAQHQQQQQSGTTLNNLSELLLMEATNNDSTAEHIILNPTAPSSATKISYSPDSSNTTTVGAVNKSRRQSIQFNTRKPLSVMSTTSQTSLFSSIDSVNSTCKACRAFEKNFHHYISYDSSNDDTIESSTQPNNNICYISQSTPSDSEVFALVRKACLRTLHCEVFEDPIYFDDDKNGSVIGYEFHIKDSEGRGQQRSYSLLIIMKDRIYLQHLWSFLSQQISIIATNIKQEAQLKFDKELKENPLNNMNQSSFNAQSIRQFANPNKKSARGLIELTDDPLIFAKLHMWFTWILRMSACQISEEFIHGPLSEDIQVRIEREKLIEQNCLNLDDRNNLSDLIFESENDNVLNGFQIETLRNIIEVIGKDYFHQIAYNLIIGNQVIIHSKYERLVSSMIKNLEELIPVGCCQSVYYSDKYIKSYECKLLGLSDKYQIQSIDLNKCSNLFDDDLNDFVYLNIELIPKCLSDLLLGLQLTNSINFNQSFNLIKEKYFLNIQIRTNVTIKQEQTPSVLTRIESYLYNESLDETSVCCLIKLVKEEWLNKTKVFHKFIKSPNVKDSFDIESVLKMLKLDRNDELALKFWQAGLSDECKIQIRTV